MSASFSAPRLRPRQLSAGDLVEESLLDPANDYLRIVRARQPGMDLRQWIAASRLDGPDPLEEPLSLAARPATLRRQLDLMDSRRQPEGMRFGVALNCRLSAAPQGSALLVSERCHGAGASFTNRYWADPATGGIWRSEQWVGEAGMMRMEVVTPPSS